MTERSPPLDGSPSRRPLLGRQCRMGARRRGVLDPFVAALLRDRGQFDRTVFVRFEGNVDGLRARPGAAHGGSDAELEGAHSCAGRGGVECDSHPDDRRTSRGEIALGYRLARVPGRETRVDRLFPLLDDPHVGLRVELSHLSPGRSAHPGRGSRRRRAHRGGRRAWSRSFTRPAVLSCGRARPAGGVGRRGDLAQHRGGGRPGLLGPARRSGTVCFAPRRRFGHSRRNTRASAKWSTFGTGAREPTQRRRCSVGECGMLGGWLFQSPSARPFSQCWAAAASRRPAEHVVVAQPRCRRPSRR